MVRVHRVDAFSTRGKGGNAAGVMMSAASLDGPQMQHIAALMGLSETAFIQPHPDADRSLRFFTPTAEVGLCGHATIASWHLLMEKGEVEAGEYRMWTPAGIQEIQCAPDGQISMSQNRPIFGPILDPNPVAACLGIEVDQLTHPQQLPVQVASTGLHKIFAPFRDLASLRAIQPDLVAIEALSRSVGAIGIYCYTLESRRGGTAHCRNFAPVVGISEDSATGTSAAATACLLYHHGIIDSVQAGALLFEQGDSLNQPSDIQVRLEVDEGSILKVWVAGRATTRAAVTLEV
jgi:PhzF family phenazine biosynthesis protein